MTRTIDEDDFNRALVGGPWVIYGHYLSVLRLSRFDVMIPHSRQYFRSHSGARHLRFHNIVKEYMKEFSHDLVCLFETQVEANWFACGIWICWNEDFPVDVLDVHLSVVYLKVCRKQALLVRPWISTGDFNSIIGSSERALDLYTVDYLVNGVFPCHGKFPSISSDELGCLLLAVFNDEVAKRLL
ncbi:hypothetical protein Gorai_019275, partial [Gossypium raimondii]|nr:hypothetical protein [Gossypium raimondii]